jgi:uncharacterized membrane protein YcaP (DUF421 family)
MEAKTVHALLNIALLQAITFLFVYIKYYFSSKGPSRRQLQESELAISVLLGFLVFFVLMNDYINLGVKYTFFILSVAVHIGSCLIIQKHEKAKPNGFPKAFMIFHNGSFLKGAILQNKLSEKQILKELSHRGVVDLSEVDTIILEPSGELSVIFKKKVKHSGSH